MLAIEGGKRGCKPTNYTAMKKLFNETKWTKIKELKDMQEKCDLFLMTYEQSQGIYSIS